MSETTMDQNAVPLEHLAGIVVTFHPERAVEQNLRAMVEECGRLIVVDNGSGAQTCEWLRAIPGVRLKENPDNLGLGAALNLGAAEAQAMGCRWIVIFDQDSRPDVGLVAALWRAHLQMPLAGLIGACIAEAGFAHAPYRPVRRHPRWPGCFQRVKLERDFDDVTMVITSGSLVDLPMWHQIGGYDAGLFIDYLDIDFCLRLRRTGRKVGVAAGARLSHQLGHRQPAQVFGRDFRPMHHAAFRHYYMARNRVHMWRRHAWAVPHWAAFDLSFALYNYLRVLLFEDQRWAKVKAIVRGTWHGLRGRTGPMPP